MKYVVIEISVWKVFSDSMYGGWMRGEIYRVGFFRSFFPLSSFSRLEFPMTQVVEYVYNYVAIKIQFRTFAATTTFISTNEIR